MKTTRFLCARHKENTPSAVLYGNRVHCFGCGANYLASEIDPSIRENIIPMGPRSYENIEETYEYIRSLPKQNIRGLQFPANEVGYYITWPRCDYYKLRLFKKEKPRIDGKDDDHYARAKYKSPMGHNFKVWEGQSNDGDSTLVMVEGEINAMSLCEVPQPNCKVISPGGAGNFLARSFLREYLYKCIKWPKIVIIADQDPAGAKAAIHTFSQLVAWGHKNVVAELWKQDANDLLVKDKDALEKLFKDTVELPSQVRS